MNLPSTPAPAPLLVLRPDEQARPYARDRTILFGVSMAVVLLVVNLPMDIIRILDGDPFVWVTIQIRLASTSLGVVLGSLVLHAQMMRVEVAIRPDHVHVERTFQKRRVLPRERILHAGTYQTSAMRRSGVVGLQLLLPPRRHALGRRPERLRIPTIHPSAEALDLLNRRIDRPTPVVEMAAASEPRERPTATPFLR